MHIDEIQDLESCLSELDELATQLEAVDTLRPLQQLARKAIQLVEHQRERLEHRLVQLSTLTEVGEILNSTLTISEVLHRIVETTTEMLDAKASTLRLLEEDGELTLQAVYNLSQRYVQKGPVNTERGILQYKALQGNTVYVPDVRVDARSQYPQEAAEEGLHSMLCTALRVRGRAIGTMSIYTAEERSFSAEEVRIFEALANQAALAIEQARLHQRELEAHELERELEIAGQIQMNLIPKAAPSLARFDIAARLIPYHNVSGDFYDFIPLPNEHLGFVIADVSGKSIPGALLMAETRAVLRTQVEHFYAVKDIVTSVNHLVSQDTRITDFVTLFYGVLNVHENVLTYTNAGHVPPILFRDNEIRSLETGGVILGFQDDSVYEEGQVPLQSGDVVVCVTDGVTEGANPQGEMFGHQRLQEVIQRHRDRSAQELVEQVYHAVDTFTGGEPTDDSTVLVVRVTDG